MKKYDLHSIMRSAWKFFRKGVSSFSLALRLQTLLERVSPGITRPVNLRTQRFNQDLSPGALLIEIGGAGNAHQEALASTDILAQAIEALLQ